MLKVLIVGSNPSQASPDNSAFHPSTKSRKTIDKWFAGIPADLHFINVSNEKTENNKPLNSHQINPIRTQLESFKNYKIIAVGKTAENVLKHAQIDHFAMPHPSGRNRKLNDRDYIRNKLAELNKYVLRALY